MFVNTNVHEPCVYDPLGLYISLINNSTNSITLICQQINHFSIYINIYILINQGLI